MQLSLSDDQAQILDAVGALAKPFSTMPSDCRGFLLTSPELDQALAEGGFLDVAFDPDLGAVTATLIVEQLARMPYAVEVGASALVRPLLGELTRPVCLVEADQATRPIRFLAPGATVVVVEGAQVRFFTADDGDVVLPHDSLFAYPMATLAEGALSRGAPHDLPADEVRTRWRIALAAEIAGLLEAAIAATVTYVSDRKQFGRPIGTFQAMRHRLAEDSVLAAGARWLALRAAFTGAPGDAALAAMNAQEAASKVVYDLHQFLGAMGMTLEHPLHLWTYRLKALIGELGGAGVNGVEAAGLIWSDRAA